MTGDLGGDGGCGREWPPVARGDGGGLPETGSTRPGRTRARARGEQLSNRASQLELHPRL